MHPIRSILLSTILVSSALPGSCTDSREVDLTAPGENQIAVKSTHNIEFMVMPGDTTVVSSSSRFAARIELSGHAEHNVVLSVPDSITIRSVYDGSESRARIDRDYLRMNTTGSQLSATVLDASSGTATTGISTDLNGNGIGDDGLGQLYLWIGGRAAGAPNARPGLYVGTVTVAARYIN